MKLLATTVLAILAACGGGRMPPRSGATPVHDVEPLPTPPKVLRARADGQAPAKAHLIATIAHKAIGPFAALTTEGGMAAWITAAEGSGRNELVVVTLAADGVPLGVPQVAASLTDEATSLVVRAAGGTRGGWLVAWSALLDRGESLSVLGLTPEGAIRGPPVDVQRTNDHIKWLDIVPAAGRASCLWAEETTAGNASILAASLDREGKPHGRPVRVARDIVGWAAVRANDGTGVALVSREGKSGGPGSLRWVRLDSEGREQGPPVSISSKPTVSGDVEVVAAGDGWLLAWTDRTGEDAEVLLAAIDAAGNVRGPTPVLEAFGGSALVGLASGTAGVVLAWEDPRAGPRPTRAMHLASVSISGGLSVRPTSSLDAAARTKPELIATDNGFALLALARACPKEQHGAECSGPIVPTFVRLDAALAPTQAEPLILGDEHVRTALAWGLRCAGEGCFALAAPTATPTPVFAVDLSPRSSPYAAPSSPPPAAEAPRVTSIATVASGQPYADIAAVRVGAATLVASLSSAAPGRQRHTKSSTPGATVAVRLIDDKATSLAGWNTVTTRALAAGGLAMAAGSRPEDGAAIAWTARDDGNAQVHLNHVDRRGRRTNEIQLTTTKGGASDVALAWVGDGWLVAWVDMRDGNGEVYASKVDRDLHRVAREERITHSPGDAGDVVLAVRGDTAWLAWSDPRESPRDGLGDIYVTTLNTHNARRSGDEVRVLATAAHSRSPFLTASGDGAFLAWIEEGPTGLDAPGAAMVARVDRKAHLLGNPTALPLSGLGRPTALAVAATGDGAHAIVARSAGEEITLDAVTVDADGVPGREAWPMVDLDAPTSFDVAVALTGDVLFYNDTGATPEDRRVRRAAMAWRP